MGLSVRDTMALIGAHTTGKQRFVDPTVANSTFDTTVDIWDTRFCKYVLRQKAKPLNWFQILKLRTPPLCPVINSVLFFSLIGLT